MDLNRLYRYRRGELEREARRLGVERPERLDRRELERRIRDASGGSTTTGFPLSGFRTGASFLPAQVPSTFALTNSSLV